MRIFIRFALLAIFGAILALVIAFARGYRFDFNGKKVTSTGIIALSSNPKAAKVYINDELKGATDINLILPPGQYHAKIKKDGYTSWEKQVSLKGELVLSLDALLFPVNPSLSPLTNLTVEGVYPLDQTGKILILSESGDEKTDGIYLFDSTRRNFSLFQPLKPVILKKDLPSGLKLQGVYFSPDYKQAILDWKTVAYLVSPDEDKNLFDVTSSKLTLLEAWGREKLKNDLKILETFPKEIAKVASDSFHIVSFSPDETKILYKSEKSQQLQNVTGHFQIGTNQTEEERNIKTNQLYVYDKKEDKNFKVEIENCIKIENCMQWYPDSRHFLFLDGKKISIVDYDGTNKQTVYSGPFQESFFTSTSDGNIIILANLNPEIHQFPDLYLVGVR